MAVQADLRQCTSDSNATDVTKQWELMQQTLSLMTAPLMHGRLKTWPTLEVDDLLGDTSSKQLLLRMSYSSLEAVGNGDWRLGLRKQVAGGVMSTLVDATGRVVSGMLLTPIATTAAAASVGLACAAPAALFQILALLAATHLTKHLSQGIQQLQLDVAFLKVSSSKGLLADGIATAQILFAVHQELHCLLQYTGSCTPTQLDHWIDLLWKRFSSSSLPLHSSRFILAQRLEALTQEVARLAGMADAEVDMVLAAACFDRAMELAQFLYVVMQSYQVHAAVAAFFVQLRQPALLSRLQDCASQDADALQAYAVQLQDVADALTATLRRKREATTWFQSIVWQRQRYRDLQRLLDMVPVLRQNCRLAAGDAGDLHFLLTRLPDGKVGVRLLEEGDPILRDRSPSLGPLWSPAGVVSELSAEAAEMQLREPPPEDLASPLLDPAQSRVMTVNAAAVVAADEVPRLLSASQVDVQGLQQLFGDRRHFKKVKTTLTCMLALTTGGRVDGGAVYDCSGTRVGVISFLYEDWETDFASVSLDCDGMRHAVEVSGPNAVWQVCATLTGHAHMHGLYQKLKEVEAACAGVVSDAEAEVLGRLQAVEHELCAALELVQLEELDPLTLQHVLQQCTDIERRICRDVHFIKSMSDVCVWACCEESAAATLNPEKLQLLLGQFQFLWHAHLLLQRCSCVQALVQLHATAKYVPQRLPVVLAQTMDLDKALAHCVGVLHTVSSFLQQTMQEGHSSDQLKWWSRVWNSEARKRITEVSERWREVCTKFGASDVGLELEQLPDGKVRVALL
eukprot:EG_transcript_2775